MDKLVTVIGLAIPLLTNSLFVSWTHDYILSFLGEILVMILVDQILFSRISNSLRKGYVEFDSFRAFPTIWSIITAGAVGLYFWAVHTTTSPLKQTCNDVHFLLPSFSNQIWTLGYFCAVALILCYFLSKIETVFYHNLHVQASGIGWVILLGLLDAGKGYWMIMYTHRGCDNQIFWAYLALISMNILIHWISSKDTDEGLVVRQVFYICALICAVLLFAKAKFTKPLPQMVD